MPSHPEFEEIVSDLRLLRRHGLTRLRQTPLPALSAVLQAAFQSNAEPDADGFPGELERLLRAAAGGLGGNMATAAEYTFGLAAGTRDWPVGDRRRRAAQVYGVSTERFRKHHEALIVNELAGRLMDLCRHHSGSGRSGPRMLHLTGVLDGRTRPVTVHAMPVEMLRDVDVVVCPGNTYLELPQIFKSSFAASLRRASATVDSVGEVLDDTIQRELSAWMHENARPGLPVAPGTVTPTGAGQLEGMGIRRVYHAAVAAPRQGVEGYEVTPAAVARSVRNVFLLAEAERSAFDPPLTSICLPLLGAGRGGLDPDTSFTWTWAALDRELRADDPWELSFVARSTPAIDAIVRGVS
jgi:O-acetyl-ADP-ribose deacetylase (regulator of RNase III)